MNTKKIEVKTVSVLRVRMSPQPLWRMGALKVREAQRHPRYCCCPSQENREEVGIEEESFHEPENVATAREGQKRVALDVQGTVDAEWHFGLFLVIVGKGRLSLAMSIAWNNRILCCKRSSGCSAILSSLSLLPI